MVLQKRMTSGKPPPKGEGDKKSLLPALAKKWGVNGNPV
jgi:hypothetical protein